MHSWPHSAHRTVHTAPRPAGCMWEIKYLCSAPRANSGTFSSVRLGDTSSPSRVVRAWMSNTRIFASMMWDRRRSPTRNMKHSFPSRRHTTAALLNCSVRVRCLGRTIFRKTSPTCWTYDAVYCRNYWLTANNFKIRNLTSRWCCWRFGCVWVRGYRYSLWDVLLVMDWYRP